MTLFERFSNWLLGLGISWQTELWASLILIAGSLLLAFLVRLLVRLLLTRLAVNISKHTKALWNESLLRNKVFNRIADLAIPIALSWVAANLPKYGLLLDKIAGVAGVLILVLLVNACLNTVDELYRSTAISKVRPLKSVFQVIKVAAIIVGGVVMVAILAGESPWVLLGGIGAMTAVTSLIFKDAILGFVAGIQLTGNDMIHIGDWIEMPGQLADGTVVDLSLTTVKVENFDKSITAIPAYSLISGAFINWRGMEMAGGRRIKRSFFIDASTVRIADEALLARFQKMALIQDYIAEKQAELARYNSEHSFDMAEPVNGRRITNIGTFRAYIFAYLKQHPGIHPQMTTIVRQLNPEASGVPLEIYAFANTTQWAQYESIQSDIFDHIYAVAREFDLCIYQQPSGNDMRSIGAALQADAHSK